jgi:putative peptidoglycan lipid II flippase
VEARQGRRLAWSAAIFSIATGISRVLGLIRDVIASYYFGARGPINAFTVAFQIPNLIRVLVGDAALSGAFVPVFNELLEKGERARAWRVAVEHPLAADPRADRGDRGLHPARAGDHAAADEGVRRARRQPLADPLPDRRPPRARQGIVVGILNTYGQFSIPALTPVAWNLVIILGLVIGVPRADTINGELYIYAASIVLGTGRAGACCRCRGCAGSTDGCAS